MIRMPPSWLQACQARVLDEVQRYFFGDYVQADLSIHNKVLSDFVRIYLSVGPGYAIYDYGKGERLTTGYPIICK